ncbi:hypothetical protein C9J21_17880 [Photobacterium phosphoreum]|uniref:hypothetical protein n=1 Tax=Photobacterium phosphoreum TaxID=659 RepID=UPI000D15527A|nr:hypothetical protein [Photobacterium phosphoreum]PSW31219.1 hypothetical protein C9J21_17880 [Photobacterium phosphoreum]
MKTARTNSLIFINEFINNDHHSFIVTPLFRNDNAWVMNPLLAKQVSIPLYYKEDIDKSDPDDLLFLRVYVNQLALIQNWIIDDYRNIVGSGLMLDGELYASLFPLVNVDSFPAARISDNFVVQQFISYLSYSMEKMNFVFGEITNERFDLSPILGISLKQLADYDIVIKTCDNGYTVTSDDLDLINARIYKEVMSSFSLTSTSTSNIEGVFKLVDHDDLFIQDDHTVCQQYAVLDGVVSKCFTSDEHSPLILNTSLLNIDINLNSLKEAIDTEIVKCDFDLSNTPSQMTGFSF